MRSNVGFGLKKNEVDDEKVWEELKQAQLKDFVPNLPNGLDTIVGERDVIYEIKNGVAVRRNKEEVLGQ